MFSQKPGVYEPEKYLIRIFSPNKISLICFKIIRENCFEKLSKVSLKTIKAFYSSICAQIKDFQDLLQFKKTRHVKYPKMD